MPQRLRGPRGTIPLIVATLIGIFTALNLADSGGQGLRGHRVGPALLVALNDLRRRIAS